MCARSTFATVIPAFFVLVSGLAFHDISTADSVALEQHKIRGARVYVIKVDLDDPRISIDLGLPKKGLAHSETFTSMIGRRGPVAAVTGTYFCTRSLLPVGSLAVGGKELYVSCIGNTVCFMPANRVRIANTAKNEGFDFTGAQIGLRTGPRLLENGRYVLNARREGFRDPGLFGSRTRMVLGITPANKLLLVSIATPVTFARTASIMKVLGAVDALALDGGTSSAMYYKGRYIRRPGRALTNIIEVYVNPETPPAVNVADSEVKVVPEQPVRIETRPDVGQPVEAQPDLKTPEQAATLSTPVSSLAKCRFACFPVDWAKLPGLKRLQYPQHFVHIAAYA